MVRRVGILFLGAVLLAGVAPVRAALPETLMTCTAGGELIDRVETANPHGNYEYMTSTGDGTCTRTSTQGSVIEHVTWWDSFGTVCTRVDPLNFDPLSWCHDWFVGVALQLTDVETGDTREVRQGWEGLPDTRNKPFLVTGRVWVGVSGNPLGAGTMQFATPIPDCSYRDQYEIVNCYPIRVNWRFMN